MKDKAAIAPLLKLRGGEDSFGKVLRMHRRRHGNQGGNARFRRGEQQCDRSAHAGAENTGFSRSALLNDGVRSLEILDFAAVSDVFELPGRLADVGEIEAQRQDTGFGELAAE